MEIFKKIRSYRTKTMHPDDTCDIYVSNCGNFKASSFRVAYSRHKNKTYRTYKEKDIKPFKRAGYLSIVVNQEILLAHRLVAEAFIENPMKKPTVNHIDGNKFNNNSKNLEWSTYSENVLHSYDNNLNKSLEDKKGAKLKNNQVLEIKQYLKNKKRGLFGELAIKYNVSVSTIKNIAYGNAWKRLQNA